MILHQIITSLLETDAYKLSMGQAIYHYFSRYKTTWTFKCRNKDVHFTPEMVHEIRQQIQVYCNLRFTEDELAYIDKIRWIKGSYVDFLRLWKPRFEDFEGSKISRSQTMRNAGFPLKPEEPGSIPPCMRSRFLPL